MKYTKAQIYTKFLKIPEILFQVRYSESFEIFFLPIGEKMYHHYYMAVMLSLTLLVQSFRCLSFFDNDDTPYSVSGHSL